MTMLLQDAHGREAVRVHVLLALVRRQVEPARAPADAPADQEVLVPRLQEDLLAHVAPQQAHRRRLPGTQQEERGVRTDPRRPLHHEELTPSLCVHKHITVMLPIDIVVQGWAKLPFLSCENVAGSAR